MQAIRPALRRARDALGLGLSVEFEGFGGVTLRGDGEPTAGGVGVKKPARGGLVWRLCRVVSAALSEPVQFMPVQSLSVHGFAGVILHILHPDDSMQGFGLCTGPQSGGGYCFAGFGGA